jgi:hypothetical protein
MLFFHSVLISLNDCIMAASNLWANHTLSQSYIKLHYRLDQCHDDDRVDGGRLRLWMAAINGPFVYPQVIYEHGNQGRVISTGKNSWFIHQSSLLSYQQSSSSKSGGTWCRKWWIWPLKYLCLYFKVIFLHAIKSYVMGLIDGFTSPLKEGLLQIFSP